MALSPWYFPCLVAACFALSYNKLPRFPCEISWTAAVDPRAHFLLIAGALGAPLVLHHDKYPLPTVLSSAGFVLLAVAKQSDNVQEQRLHDIGVNTVLILNAVSMAMGPYGAFTVPFFAVYAVLRPICKVGSLYFLARRFDIVQWTTAPAVTAKSFLELVQSYRARGEKPMSEFVDEQTMMWLSGLHQWSLFLICGYFVQVASAKE